MSQSEQTPDARRQLEGRLERLEQACERHRVVRRFLARADWEASLREDADWVEGFLAREREVDEALCRLRQRVRVEGWAEGHLARRLAAAVEGGRARLEALAGRRLGELTEGAPPPGLGPRLLRLREAVRAPPASPLRPTEQVVLDTGRPGGGPWGAGLLRALRPGRAILTSERLVWMPPGAAPLEVPLARLGGCQVRVHPWRHTVEARGAERRLRLPRVRMARPLAAHLALHCHVQAQREAHAGRGGREGPGVSALARARFEPGAGRCTEGVVLARPGYVAFLPEGSGARALAALCGQGGPVGERVLLRALAGLPPEVLDAQVAAAVAAVAGVGGVLWPAAGVRVVDVRALTHPPSPWAAPEAPGDLWRHLHFIRGMNRLTAHLAFDSRPAFREVLGAGGWEA